MKSTQILFDKLAIGLSMLCAIHCLVLPLILVLIPSVVALQLDNEVFHRWMVIAVIPTSLYALTLGCRQHKHYRLLAFGLAGLLFLIAAIVLGERFIGESWEKILTILGAMSIAYGHYQNYRLCQQNSDCFCSNERE